MATEWLWMNFPPPLELHDYRYLGQTFRERERIQRKRKRWTARLRCMPALERYAILSAIADLKVDRTSPVPAGPAGPSKSGDGGRLIIAP